MLAAYFDAAWRRWLPYLPGLALLCLCLAGLGAATAGQAADNAPAEQNAAAGRQVLVMLPLPAPHFRPDANYAGRYGDDQGRGARRRLAEELARNYGMKLVSDWPMQTLGMDCYVLEATGIANNFSAASVADQLSQDPRVAWAQPVSDYSGLGGDPLYPVQPGAKYWHLAEIHQLATGRNVTVAVIDSGVEATHPDLNGQVALQANFVDGNPYQAEWHGTAVAGIIAAKAGNGVGIVGVAPQANLLALRACWQESAAKTRCNSFSLGKALNFAILHEAQVINLSLTGPQDKLLQRLLDAALRHGIKVVGAIDPHSADWGFPASHPGVLAVADEQAAPLVLGADVVLAPGRDIPTTVPGGRWNFVSGSSYAAAHVSGMAALLTELRPGLSATELRSALRARAPAALDAPAAITQAKFNRNIDACATITRIAGSCPCSCQPAHASKAVHAD